MPVKLNSYKVDADGEIRVLHTFFADTDEEAEALMAQHGEGCAAFGPALAAGTTIEIYEDIAEDEMPDAGDLAEIAEAEEDDDEPDELDDDEEDEEEDEEG
jgi:hypothetical protein